MDGLIQFINDREQILQKSSIDGKWGIKRAIHLLGKYSLESTISVIAFIGTQMSPHPMHKQDE